MKKTFKVCTYHIALENANPIYKKIYTITNKINKKYCEINRI